jgi:hypothetical protein
MRATGLWRFAPRLQIKMDPNRAAAGRPELELVPPELQRRMVAAFERARAERLAAQTPQPGPIHASDPWVRANTAAFLALERERRAIATRLCRRHRRPADRYRDLVLVTKLLRLEYEHLAGRVGGRDGAPAPPNGLPVGGDMPAEWARPWGSGPMVEIGTAFAFYRDQRDRLARQLRTPTLRRAAAAAAQRRDGILTRFERAMGEWSPELEHGSVAAANPGKRRAATAIAETAGDGKRAWPWVSLGLSRPAVALAALFAVVGVGTVVAETRGGGSAGFASAPSPTVASVPGSLVAVAERWLEPQPARGPGGRHGASHRSKRPAREHVADADQAVLAASETPPAPPLPEAAPAPVAPAAPVAPPPPAPAPAPPPAEPPPPEPRPDPKPRPGPVSPLPPPVNTLPPPGGSSSGGG